MWDNYCIPGAPQEGTFGPGSPIPIILASLGVLTPMPSVIVRVPTPVIISRLLLKTDSTLRWFDTASCQGSPRLCTTPPPLKVSEITSLQNSAPRHPLRLRWENLTMISTSATPSSLSKNCVPFTAIL